MDIELAKKVSIESVKEAGKLLMDNLDEIKKATFKAKSDMVTNVDIESEKLLINKIKKIFPEHSILSEERGFIDNDSKYIWILDPIDGTMNYYHCSPPFRVGVCLLKNKKPVISAIYNPVKDQLFFAERGKGATLNDKIIKVSNNSNLTNSMILTHLSSKKEARIRTIVALESIFKKTLHMRMFGCGLASITYVASGKFDVFFNVKTNPWDILPGVLLIEEAGGTITEINGEEITYNSTSVLATNGNVHDQILKLLEDI